jgi:hypothetical protein
MIVDRFGRQWFVATRKESIAPDKASERYKAMMQRDG